MDPSPSSATSLSPIQHQVVGYPLDSRLFVSGRAGTGKTTAGVARLTFLLEQGVPAESILMLTPQRSLQEPYFDLLSSPARLAGGEVTSTTMGGISHRICELFWPLAAETAGFGSPDRPPIFLNLETAQYYMAYLVRPLLDQGYFESLTMNRNRLYSQIMDNLNKASLVGFPYTEIGARLNEAFVGDPAQRRVYEDAQDCAARFREYCLAHNLLDYSLQLEIFTNILWPQPQVREYLARSYRHLIYDNLEEDGARPHDVMREWLADFQSTLLIFDEGGGYRRFLGADAETGRALADLCDEHIVFSESFVMSDNVAALEAELGEVILSTPSPDPSTTASTSSARRLRANGKGQGENAFQIITSRFYPSLLDSVSDEISRLFNDEGLQPSEIAVVSPYLSDALRFSIMNRLEAREIPVRSHRPSRSLYDEPASHALITLAALAHPHWNTHPPKFDVAYAFMQSLEGLDLVRAQLLAEIVYGPRDLRLTTFDEIKSDVQERITYVHGGRYTILRDWLIAYRESMPLPLDHFFRKLFGEVLSQPGFGYHSDFDSIRVAASLVDSVKNFRMAMEPSIVERDRPDFDFGKEYVTMLEEGVIAASYLEAWRTREKNAVLVAPAYTFILMNHPVTVQFWLDAGSNAWHERLAQPITQPYVLSRGWEPGRTWSDADDVTTDQEAMGRIASGLLHRCRERVYLGLPELSESGFEQTGALLRAFQKVLQTSSQ